MGSIVYLAQYRARYPLHWTEIMADPLNRIMFDLLQKQQTKYYRIDGLKFYCQLHRLDLLFQLFHNYDKKIHENLLQKIDYSLPLTVYHNSDSRLDKFRRMSLERFRQLDTVFMRLYDASMQKCRNYAL